MCEEKQLDHLSRERVYEEYGRILMATQPSLGLNFLKNVHGLPKYLEDLVHTHQRPDFHPEGSVWNHTLLVVDLCANIKEETSWPLAFMWSALLHDIGKPSVTTKEGHAYNHHLAGVTVFNKSVTLIQDKKMRKYIAMMIKQHMTLMVFARDNSRPIKYKQLLKEIDGIVPLNDLIWITRCDKMGRGYIASRQIDAFNKWMDQMIASYGDQAEVPLVSGKDLIAAHLEDHKRYKTLLNQAYKWQLEGLNKEQIIRRLKRER
jgi:tRNA nucleotidyltransferase (CCA-adding enzyme)